MKKIVYQIKSRSERGFSHVEIFFAIVFIAIIGFIGAKVLTSSFAASPCDPTANLYNPCRPLVGAAAGGYNMVGSDQASQFAFADKRLNDPSVLTSPSKAVTLKTTLDVYHTYHTVGNNNLNSFEVNTIKSNTLLATNYKPSDNWSDAAGGNASVNANIKAFADKIKAAGPHKVLLSIYHEPEDNIKSDPNCPNTAYKGSSGTPADYVAMWHNVRKIFDQEGVTNVVWSMNYMGYSKWNCNVASLWPGNSYVDWVTWDNYGSGNGTSFVSSVKDFYNYLSSTSNSTHNYTSKVWGLNEFGYHAAGSTQAGAINYWNDAEASIKNNTFPKLKLYNVFDTSVNGTSQVGMDFSGKPSTDEQAAYNSFVKAVQALGNNGGTSNSAPAPAPAPAPTPTPTPTPPSSSPVVSITSPTSGSTVSGIVTIQVDVNQSANIKRVVLDWDGHVIRDAAGQNDYGWGSRWDSTDAPNSKHLITATAYDSSGKVSKATLSLIVSNGSGSSGSTTTKDTTAPTVSITSPDNWGSVSGTALFKVSANDNVGVTRVVLKDNDHTIRDARAQDPTYGWGSRYDVRNLYKGWHAISATVYDAAGNTSTSVITVKFK